MAKQVNLSTYYYNKTYIDNNFANINHTHNEYISSNSLIDELGDILDGMIELAPNQLVLYNIPSAIAQNTANKYFVRSEYSSESFQEYGSIEGKINYVSTYGGNIYYIEANVPVDFELDYLTIGTGSIGSVTRLFDFPSDLTVENKTITVDFNNLTEEY